MRGDHVVKIYIVSILVVTMMVAASSAAQAPEPVVAYKQAAVHMHAARWSEAERLLVEVVAAWPRQPDVRALRGMARYHLGKYNMSADDLEFALDNDTKYTARALYYLGLSMSKLGKSNAAQQAFRRLVERYPDSPEAAKLGKPIREMVRKRLGLKKGRPFSFVLSLEGAYDTNPSQTAEGDGDAFATVYASARGDIKPIRIGGSVFSQKYVDQSALDFLGLSANVEVNRQIGRRNEVRPRLIYSRYMLDSKACEDVFAGELSCTRTWSECWSTILTGRGGTKIYVDEVYGDLEGNSLKLDCSTRWTARPGGCLRRIKLMATWSDEGAEAEHWAYTAWLAGLGLEFNIGKRTILTVSAKGSEREYDDVNPTYTVIRSDTSASGRLSLERTLTDDFSVRLYVAHTKRDSNIDDYTYDQTIAGLGVMYTP